MGSTFQSIDRLASQLARGVLRWRWLVVAVALAGAVTIGGGAQHLEFANNYRVFFSDENPELTAFEDLQATYTKNDNFLFVLEPAGGDAFSADTVAAVESLTEAAWQIPFAIRVDSISNFQHSYGIDDDLIVEDLFRDSAQMDNAERYRRGDVALSEPLLRGQLVTDDGSVTAVNVVLQYPEQSLTEVPEAVAFARDLRDTVEAEHPQINVSLTGVSMLNNAFAETGTSDLGTLVPLMFAVILLLTLAILRSAAATFATLAVIMLSSMVGMGWAGFMGIKLTPISGSAPIIILTLAIADSIHILISLRNSMRDGMAKNDAIVEALRLNFLPVTITSLTTIIGFLALNFSDSPPFWHLGNITAVGIAAAWAYSISLLPALISILPYRQKQTTEVGRGEQWMGKIAEFVIANPRRLLISIGAGTLTLMAFIPSIDLNDQWTHYFDQRVEFRQETDQALQHFGMYPIEYSVPAKDSGGVSEPEYLSYLEQFTDYLRGQQGVTHVYSLSDIMKRLNKNLHGDDQSYYRTPGNRDEAAQYLLLYELSLPYGLDLNDRINIDKSATRISVTLGDVDSVRTRAFLDRTDDWMQENLPGWMQAKPTSAQVMFTYIAGRNVENMISGTIVAIVAIAVILMLALQSFRLGLLSLVPNGLPILATFGAWALLVGEVGFSVATVASISLGIVVDDTVHLLSKYVRARREREGTAADAIRYAFKNVGVAIIVNTVILTIGFLVLMTSSFKVNVDHPDQPEPNQDMLQVFRPGMPGGRAANAAAFVVPGSALDDEAAFSRRRRGPFENLAGGIKKPERASAFGEAAYGHGVEGAPVVAVEPPGIITVPPGKAVAFGPAGGFFPFDLRRQAPGLSCTLRKPRCIGPCIFVVHHHHGMIHAVLWGCAIFPGVSAGAAVGVDQLIGSPGPGIHVGWGIAGRPDKGLVLGIGNQGFGDPISARINSLTLPFAFIPTPFTGPAVAIGGFVQAVGRFPFGPVRTGNERPGGNFHRFRDWNLGMGR